MNAPGKGLLKVVSILFIIFGVLATIASLLMVIGSAAVTALGGGAIGGILLISTILLFLVSVLELIIGIIGVGRSGDPTKAGFFIVTGIILCVLALASLIIGIASSGFQWQSCIGFILPILYIVGGAMNKKAAEGVTQ